MITQKNGNLLSRGRKSHGATELPVRRATTTAEQDGQHGLKDGFPRYVSCLVFVLRVETIALHGCPLGGGNRVTSQSHFLSISLSLTRPRFLFIELKKNHTMLKLSIIFFHINFRGLLLFKNIQPFCVFS